MSASPTRPEPRQTILFTGHMVDAPDRPRAALSGDARRRRRRGASQPRSTRSAPARGPRADARRCRRRPAVRRSVSCARLCRCACCCRSPNASSSPRRCCRWPTAPPGTRAFAPSSRGSTTRRAKRRSRSARWRRGEDPFVRANLWLLASALARRRRAGWCCICLWDGGGGDGPGGTRHLVEAVRAAGGRVLRIDTRSAFAERWRGRVHLGGLRRAPTRCSNRRGCGGACLARPRRR